MPYGSTPGGQQYTPPGGTGGGSAFIDYLSGYFGGEGGGGSFGMPSWFQPVWDNFQSGGLQGVSDWWQEGYDNQYAPWQGQGAGGLGWASSNLHSYDNFYDWLNWASSYPAGDGTPGVMSASPNDRMFNTVQYQGPQTLDHMGSQPIQPRNRHNAFGPRKMPM